MFVRTLIAGSVLLLQAGLATAQQQPAETPRTISVSGTGTVEREPDRAVLTLAVESEAPTAQEASAQNAERMESMIGALRQAGVPQDDIRTVSYQLSPVYSRTRPEQEAAPRIAGYRAVNMVQVTLDEIARVGAVIDAAIAAGANRVANLSFGLRDPQAARIDAIESAVQAARREAEATARAVGQQLGEPVSVTTSGGFPEPRPVPMMMEADISRAATPIEGGTVTVMVMVHIVYRLVGS